MKRLAILILSIIVIACDQKEPLRDDIQEKSVESWHFESFEKVDSINPILKPSPDLEFTDPITKNLVKWEERNVLNPTALVRNDTVFLLYRAQDLNGTSRIGMAISTDGLHFTKQPAPIFYPDNDDMKVNEWNYKKSEAEQVNSEECYFCYFDGVEDPRIVMSESGEYFMTYTSYDGKTARLSIASSKDLKTWTKHGLVLSGEEHKDTWSKAGAIVSELVENQVVAKKINGLYWMYFGDTNLFIASSKDLIHWDIAINEESKKMFSVLHPRPGYFDSRLVEPGPYALYTDNGILLIYNASNAANFNDPSLPKFTYAAAQALFDKEAPYKLMDRTESYFIHPDKDYEKVGEVNEVCFVEGLVYFKDQWFLYYGTADSKIAVAVSQDPIK
ncbi:glycoside hydrolase family 130 protein [Fulvivirga lutimaris]|uniref:glycoside hydrolase family 130 protein n=1 Tax=Fulvivirga lutimaris TaxID=1819566 RepID=UPI0012BC0465|nr:glycoside hydrolase family 130 protein [Fulvivirga lutimaris]MTI38217.1 glycosidase [Fulvivirga lutimaris]